MSSRRFRRLQFQALEDRILLSADLVDGVLTVVGTKGNDTIEVETVDANVSVTVNGEVHLFGAADVSQLRILALSGHDDVTVNENVLIDAFIDGGQGHDHLIGGGGNDEIHGRQGHDVIEGGAGDDLLFGEQGKDELHGGDGDDLLDGGNGKDRLWGDDGADEMYGGNGKDSLDGGDDDDWLDGGNGKDSLKGDRGNDALKGGRGKDYLNGGQGINLLDPDKGKDTLLNGMVVDLDLQGALVADLTGSSGATGQARYEIERADGDIELKLVVDVQNAEPGAVLDVFVDGVLVGEITVDAGGNGTLDLSSDPDEPGETDLPAGFPAIEVGTVITVGDILTGVFAA